MIDPKKINDAIKSAVDSMPDGLKQIPGEMKENLNTLMHSAFDKMDLVTREEFETQQKVLEKTRQKVDALEAELKKHEQK